jgi:hypothetical protein
MIKANELRIGNWVIDSQGNYYKWQVYDWTIDDNQDVEPIPLSPEILEKAGFEKVNHVAGYSFYYLKKKGIPAIAVYERRIEINGSANLFHIKHLHQLQNLYFALTGEELSIEL